LKTSLTARAARALACILVLACAAGVASTPAQAAGFHLFGSYADLDLGDEVPGIGFGYGIRMAYRWDLDLRATFYDSARVEGLGELFAEVGGLGLDDTVDFIPIDVGPRFNFTPSNAAGTVYVGAGASYFLLDAATSADDELGFYGMVGANFVLGGGPRFFVEGIYRFADGNIDTSTIPGLDRFDGIDIPLDGLALNFGIVFLKR
jgi:hypothetical protein